MSDGAPGYTFPTREQALERQVQIAKLALEMISCPRTQGGATTMQSNSPAYLKNIATIALVRMIHAEYDPLEKNELSEVCL